MAKQKTEVKSFQDLERAVQRASALLEVMAGTLACYEETRADLGEHHGDTACGYIALAHEIGVELRQCFHGYHESRGGDQTGIDYKKLYDTLKDLGGDQPRWN